MDASEPDIESNASIDYRKLLSTPIALAPATKYFRKHFKNEFGVLPSRYSEKFKSKQ